MALLGRLLESAGFRVAILSQPDWRSVLRRGARSGLPRLFFGISAGNMDSDDQPLHREQEGPERRRLQSGRERSAAVRIERRSPIASGRARPIQGVPIVAGGVEGEPAPDRALRLLERQGAPLRS